MKERRITGIILSVVNYRDHDQVVTILSESAGVLGLFAKGSRKRCRGRKRSTAASLPLLGPLMSGDFLLEEGHGELFKVRELQLLDSYVGLRSSLPHLQTACSIVTSVRLSQLPGKPAPRLYALLEAYLRQLPKLSPCNEAALLASFRLKTLKHDGLLALQTRCSCCQQELLSEIRLCRGGCYCEQHAPFHAIAFDGKERAHLDCLANSTSLRQINELVLSERLGSHIQQLFSCLLERSEKV